MFIFCSIIVAVVLVTLGYFALWTTSQANVSKGLSLFGKVMAIVLFITAGLMLLLGSLCCGNKCGYGKKMHGRYMSSMKGKHSKYGDKDKCHMGKKTKKHQEKHIEENK
jgi:hypothetical protein